MHDPRLPHRRIRTALRTAPLVLLAGGLAAVAVGPTIEATAASSTVVVKEMSKPKVGTILVNSQGMTLYRFTKDTSTTVACTGACAMAWPPLVLASGAKAATAGPGVKGLGTIKDPDGMLQVTFKSQPLYMYTGDKTVSDVKGQGVEGTWFVVKPTAASTGTVKKSTPPTTAKPSGGYGY